MFGKILQGVENRKIETKNRNEKSKIVEAALAAIPDADGLLDTIATENGVALAQLPPARRGYLLALLAEGRHCDALARCGMAEQEFYTHWQDQRFRRVLRALHEVIEDIRRIKRHDHLDQRSYESDKVAMFVAERLDPRYVPPQVIARQGDKTNIQAVQINVMLPNGRPVGDHSADESEKSKIYGGFSSVC